MRNLLFLILLHSTGFVYSQSTFTCRYWFNDQDVNSANTISYTSNTAAFLNTSSLPVGYHKVFLYFIGPDGLRSSVLQSDFVKVSVESGVTAAEYWFNNDRSTKKNILVPGLTDFSNGFDIPTDELPNGEHTLSIRFLQSGGLWSSITSSSFTKTTKAGGVSGLEYWFDEDIQSKKSLIGTLSSFTDKTVDASKLTIGYHSLHMRFIKDGGIWSPVSTSSFFKREASANAVNRLKSIRYWFDDDFENKKERLIIASSFEDIITQKDCEHLPEGRHLFSFQVQDSYGIWSSVQSDSFTRMPIGFKELVYPKLYSAKSSFQLNDPIVYRGADFQPGGYYAVTLKEVVTGLVVYESFEKADPLGTTVGSFRLDESARGGAYVLGTRDLSSNNRSNDVRIRINRNLNSDFSISSPIAGSPIIERQALQVSFRKSIDEYEQFMPIRTTATSTRIYRGEYSVDNGLNWIVFETGMVKADKLGINTYSFPKPFFPPSTGNYLFRVTDLTTGAQCETDFITVEADPNSSPNYTVNLLWDNAGFGKSKVEMPEGLAADSISRIIVNLKRTQGFTKPINSIAVEILPEGYLANNSRLLGRISAASTINSYSNEADLPGTSYAVGVSTEVFPVPTSSDYYFWLCAPTDFAQSLEDFSTERFIKLRFIVNYADNTNEIFERGRIKIVRPPLMMVHGLGGNQTTFDETSYDLAGSLTTFKSSPLWREKMLAELSPSESFDYNAKVLLGFNGDKRYFNSIPDLIRRMRDQGIACSRVDYVAHSMGGSIARRMMEYTQYRNFNNQNYNKGLINKFITVNTPHQGSPVADLVVDMVEDFYSTSIQEVVNEMLNPSKVGALKLSSELALQLYTATNALKSASVEQELKVPEWFDEFVRIDYTTGLLYSVKPTNAVLDLQGLSGGYVHKESWVKNSLIGGRFIDIPGVSGELIEMLNSVPLGGPLDYKTLYNNDFLENIEFLYNVLNKTGILGETAETIKGAGDMLLNVVRGFNLLYGIDFILNSDGVVPVLSQTAAVNTSHNYNEVDQVKAEVSRTLAYADRSFSVNPVLWQANHVSTKSWIKTGNRIMVLLNAPLNSGFFANSIAASPVQNLVATRNSISGKGTIAKTSFLDSILVRFDTSHVKIMSPSMSDTVQIGRKIRTHIAIRDTSGLIAVKLFVQSKTFNSNSKITDQFFDYRFEPERSGATSLLVQAIYDSAGYKLVHTDFTTVYLEDSLSTAQLFLPKQRFYVNPGQEFYIPVLGQTDSNAVSVSYDKLSVEIANTSVVSYDSLNNRFLGADSGTTYIVFRMGDLRDTAFIYLSQPLEDFESTVCQRSLFRLGTPFSPGAIYQWQMDSGAGFTDLLNGPNFADVAKDTLLIMNPANQYLQYKFRCKIIENGITSFSTPAKIGVLTVWNGQIDTDWANPNNWDCQLLPDEFSDVVIPTGKAHYPSVFANVSINSLTIQSGAIVTVANGKSITLKSKQ